MSDENKPRPFPLCPSLTSLIPLLVFSSISSVPADNLNVDESGDIWVAAFPKGLTTLAHFQNPHEKVSPTTVFKISRNKVVGRLIWSKFSIPFICAFSMMISQLNCLQTSFRFYPARRRRESLRRRRKCSFWDYCGYLRCENSSFVSEW